MCVIKEYAGFYDIQTFTLLPNLQNRLLFTEIKYSEKLISTDLQLNRSSYFTFSYLGSDH